MTKARNNPFAGDRIEREIEFDPAWCGTTWSQILERWRHLEHRAAIVGPHGSGKTFFLRAFGQRIDSPVERFFLNEETPTLSTEDWQRLHDAIAAGSTILLDGSEQLSWTARRKFQHLTRQQRVIVTRHRQAHWPTLLKTTSSPELLIHLIEKLSSERLSVSGAKQLLSRHKGNVREALWECYDRAGNENEARRRIVHFQRSQPMTDFSTTTNAADARRQSQ